MESHNLVRIDGSFPEPRICMPAEDSVGWGETDAMVASRRRGHSAERHAARQRQLGLRSGSSAADRWSIQYG